MRHKGQDMSPNFRLGGLHWKLLFHTMSGHHKHFQWLNHYYNKLLCFYESASRLYSIFSFLHLVLFKNTTNFSFHLKRNGIYSSERRVVSMFIKSQCTNLIQSIIMKLVMVFFFEAALVRAYMYNSSPPRVKSYGILYLEI